jgi:predicted amino acid dehydrogenase
MTDRIAVPNRSRTVTSVEVTESNTNPLALAVALVSARRGGHDMNQALFDLLGLNGNDLDLLVARTVAASIGLAELANLLLTLLADAKSLTADDLLQYLAVSLATAHD